MGYLPTSNQGLSTWAANFNQKIGALADPTTVGLSAAEVAQYDVLTQEYIAKLAASEAPETRGGSTINARNIAKKKLTQYSREFAMAVTNHPGVTDEQRYDFGLTQRDDEPTPVPPPATQPVITLVEANGRTIKYRLRDIDTPNTRAKPEGVQGALIMTAIGEEPPASVSDWNLQKNVTRTSGEITFPATVEDGTRVWMTAFWYNTKGQSGPPATAVSTYIYSVMQPAA